MKNAICQTRFPGLQEVGEVVELLCHSEAMVEPGPSRPRGRRKSDFRTRIGVGRKALYMCVYNIYIYMMSGITYHVTSCYVSLRVARSQLLARSCSQVLRQ
jgi:hypothetical protein